MVKPTCMFCYNLYTYVYVYSRTSCIINTLFVFLDMNITNKNKCKLLEFIFVAFIVVNIS